MEKHHKLNWKTGLDITPEIFIASDNYHIFERNLLGYFLSCNLYGTIPDGKFYFEKKIENNKLFINDLECSAISRYGYLIRIDKDKIFNKELDLSKANETKYYVVLTVNPYSVISTNKEEDFVYPEYNLALITAKESIENGIPILKIFREGSSWAIDKDYIPPAISINAIDTIVQLFNRIKNETNFIIDKIPENYLFYPQLIMLQFEMNNFSLQETPKELILIMKKFLRIFQLFLKNTKNMENLPELIHFLEEKYNHLEIGNLLKLGINSLMLVNQKIDEKPVDELMEIKI